MIDKGFERAIETCAIHLQEKLGNQNTAYYHRNPMVVIGKIIQIYSADIISIKG